MLQTDFKNFPTLTTERLLLREIKDADVNELFFLRSDKQVLKYLDKKPSASLEETLQWIRLISDLQKNGDALTWAICQKESFKTIGTFCFWNFQKEHYRAEIGYCLHPHFHQQGIMSEAMKAALDYGFKEIKFHSVEANVNPQNIASIKILERNKFVKEAHFKENYFFNGTFIDSAIYSLLSSKHLKL